MDKVSFRGIDVLLSGLCSSPGYDYDVTRSAYHAVFQEQTVFLKSHIFILYIIQFG